MQNKVVFTAKRLGEEKNYNKNVERFLLMLVVV